MDATTQDEGWLPAIKGLFTWQVWRPGQSSVIARVRAIWIGFVIATLLLVGVTTVIDSAPILERWIIYAGWVVFASSVVLALFFNLRLRAAVMTAPAEGIASVFSSRWFRAAAAAWAPMMAAGSLARASGGFGFPRYPVYWAAVITLTLLAVIVPGVRRLRRLDVARFALDGRSVAAAVSARTAKIDRTRGTNRSWTRR